MLSRYRGSFLINWIPAVAGMTQFGLMDNLGSREKPYAQNHKQQAHYGDYQNNRGKG